MPGTPRRAGSLLVPVNLEIERFEVHACMQSRLQIILLAPPAKSQQRGGEM